MESRRKEVDFFLQDVKAKELDALDEVARIALYMSTEAVMTSSRTTNALLKRSPQAMLELRSLLQSLADSGSSGSRAEYVLGYEPVGPILDLEDRRAIKQWNGFQSRAWRIVDARKQDDAFPAERLRASIKPLVEEVAKFIAERHRLAEWLKESQSGGDARLSG